MPIQVVFFLAFAAFAVFYGVHLKRRTAAQLGPAMRSFLERTGYRHVQLGNAPIEQHVAHYEAAMRDMAKGFQLHLVRNVHGAAIHHVQTGHVTQRGWATSTSWSLPLVRQPSVVFQIADRSLSGFGKMAKEALSNHHRSWSARFPHQVAIGDSELDQRFLCFVAEPIAARRIGETPGLKQLLLACPEVDLVAGEREVVFSDPAGKNLDHSAPSLAARMDAQVPVHDRIAELLLAAARAGV